MKNLLLKRSVFSVFTATFFILSICLTSVVNAQEKTVRGSDLEKMQEQSMDYMKQIHEITKDYPAFSYTYTIDDGEVQDVTVTGVEDVIDRKRLEVLLFDLKSNKNMLKNKANTVGVFYSVDKEAEYEGGREELQDKIINNLEYPEDAKDWGVEGTVYVKFVVDENGEIPFATTSTNIETSVDRYLSNLEEQAVEAVKATSGQWEPAKVNDVEVASLA
ncbi:MAG: energy transducer TonB, partial [Prolixibacteraceae bacterium]